MTFISRLLMTSAPFRLKDLFGCSGLNIGFQGPPFGDSLTTCSPLMQQQLRGGGGGVREGIPD